MEELTPKANWFKATKENITFINYVDNTSNSSDNVTRTIQDLTGKSLVINAITIWNQDDVVLKALHGKYVAELAKAKPSEGTDIFDKLLASKTDTVDVELLQLRVDMITDVVTVRVEEREAKAKREADRKATLDRLEVISKAKANAASKDDENKSLEELEAEEAELRKKL